MNLPRPDRSKVGRSIVRTLMQHNLSIGQMAALCEPQNSEAARRVAELAILLLGEPAKIAQVRANGNYPELSDQMSTRTTYLLRRGNVDDVGCLQVLSEMELRDIRNAGDKTIEEIRRFLAGQGLRIRFDDEPRRKRLREIFEDPSRIPLSHLCHVWTENSGINTPILNADQVFDLRRQDYLCYGDLTGVTRESLATREHSDYRKGNVPLFSPAILNAVEDELAYFNLGFASS